MKLGDVAVPINWLIRSNWLKSEMRVAIIEAKVRQYAEEMRDGAVFPRPIVFIDATGLYWVADGFHRILAIKANGATEVNVVLKRGRFVDACIAGIEANREQRGMPFSTGDKRRCIETLLRECPDWPPAKISETVGCSYTHARRYEKALVERGEIQRPENVHRRRDGRTFPMVDRSSKASKARRAEILKLRQRGMAVKEIGRQLSLSRVTVASILQQAQDAGKTIVCPACNGTGRVPKSTEASHEQS